MMKWDQGRWPNFEPHEFECTCCGAMEMDPRFLDRLQAARNRIGGPLGVSSGYRCPDYNERISSTGRDGPHTTGRAADIAVHGGKALRLVVLGQNEGMTGIGVAQSGDGRFVHLDDLGDHETEGPRPWIWSY